MTQLPDAGSQLPATHQDFRAASVTSKPLYLCLPEPLRGLSLEEVSLDELSFVELSFDELSFEPLSDLALSSFFSFEEESPLLPNEPGDGDFLA